MKNNFKRNSKKERKNAFKTKSKHNLCYILISSHELVIKHLFFLSKPISRLKQKSIQIQNI